MSRADALEQYANALRLGKKYYAAAVARKADPYPRVLEKELGESTGTSMVKVGLMDMPMDRIVGTWAEGRKAAFAGNFMPLLEPESEFAQKWMGLCEAHLEAGGIRDAISCYEYLGEFYVQEGHKRVSVLKHFGAVTIAATVTRVMPVHLDEEQEHVYHEFLQFFKASHTYVARLTRPGGYAHLQAAMGLKPDEIWDEETRRTFERDYRVFEGVYNQMNTEGLTITAGDALVAWLEVYSFAELREMTPEALRASLNALWGNLRLLSKGEHISVATEPEKNSPTLFGRNLGMPKIKAAFIYENDPAVSPWAAAHEKGQHYLEEALGDDVSVRSYLITGDPDETMEKAVADGAGVIFATTPPLMDACRRLAAKHKNVAIYNCSLSMPYTGVRSYYGRAYEVKFIAGAIAGVISHSGHIGYVANYPIMGAISAVNAFALGARMTNPDARILLKWSCLPGDPLRELREADVAVISNRDAEGSVPIHDWQVGTYRLGASGHYRALTTPRWNWGAFYEKTVRTLMAGGVDAVRDSSRAINDWWGLDTGMVDIDMEQDIPDGVRRLGDILKDGIISGRIDPFRCELRDTKGELISDGTRRFTMEELMHMDWLVDNVEGSIPAFDELLPQSRELVRVLGIYRDLIPPKAEEETP